MVMNAQTAAPQNGTCQLVAVEVRRRRPGRRAERDHPRQGSRSRPSGPPGRVYDLAHVLHQDIPAFPGRTFRQYLTTNYHQINRRRPDAGPEGLGRNSVNWIVEQVTATQQMGTHLDGLNHLQIGDRTYNGYRLADIVEDHGTNRLGIDTLPQVVTRGLLLDVAAARGGERLQPGDVITVADAEAALAVPGTTSGPATRCCSTPAGALWGADNERYASGEPGPGMALARWLADHRVALTGCDTWSFGPYPPEDPDEPFVVPQTLNIRHGVVVVENLRLDDAARDRVAEFLLVISHAKLRGRHRRLGRAPRDRVKGAS